MTNNNQTRTAQDAMTIDETTAQTLLQSWNEAVYTLAANDAFADRLKAALTHQVMSNTAMLAEAAEKFSRLVPNESGTFSFIVRAYAASAMGRVIGGDHDGRW